jgi:hypothetical protein
MIGLLVPYTAGGILCAILVNRFFVRHFSDEHRKPHYVITVLLFLCAGGLLFLVHGAKIKITEIVDKKTLELTDYVLQEYPENPLVSDGYDISRLSEALIELRAALPASLSSDSSLPGKIADKVYHKIVDRTFHTLQGNIRAAQNFAENDRITFSSILYGLKTYILSRFNRIVFYVRVTVLAVLLIYTAYCLYVSKKEKPPETSRI